MATPAHSAKETDREVTLTPFRSEADRFRKIVETANEGIWTIDHLGCTTYVNRRMADMLDYSADEMLGRPHTDFMFPGDQPQGDAEMELRRQGTTAQWDQRYRRKGGDELWTLASCCPLYRDDGTFAGALGMFTDITARKRMELELLQREQQLQSALKSRDDFLAMVSHELRAPLNPILLLASERASRLEATDPDRPIFETIAANARHQARLIDDLLDLTKIGQGKLALHKVALEIGDVVRACVASIKPVAEAKNVSLSCTLANGPMTVLGDADRLQQVVSNVVNNSVKFTPAGGKIDISTRMGASGFIQITCSDTGLGMTRDEISRAFEPFAQGDHVAGESRFGGLGLGLALSRMILELHDGKISATSAGRGSGSKILVELPAHRRIAPGAATAPHRAERLDTTSLAGLSVLVVDDHGPTRLAMGQLLKYRKCEVHLAGTVAEAVRTAERGRVDLLLCDLGLPDGDGCELMKELSSKYGVKGIALTGFGRAEDVERGKAAGFSFHLTKPIDIRAVETAVVRVVGEL